MINAANYRNTFFGNGVATTANYGFPISDKAFLLATKTIIATQVESTLVVDTDYTVAGVGQDPSTGLCVVTFAAAPANGVQIVFTPNYPLLQKRDFNNQGGFLPKTHEDAFDQVTLILQQQQEQLDRSLKAPIGSPTPLPDDLLATINAQANAATASAAAALVSQNASASSASNASASAVAAAATAVALGNAPAFTAYFSTTPSFPAATFTKMPFDLEIKDLGSHYDTTLYRWTPAKLGSALIGINARPEDAYVAAKTLAFAVRKNGSDLLFFVQGKSSPTGSEWHSHYVCPVEITSLTDYFEVYARNDDTVSRTMIGGNAQSLFWGKWIGN